ncbi:DUF4143 domain-containing protein [Corynebacterium sp. Q4381]|uniref:ATP-binding protein n=1 Tax=Corynebacterium sp. Marseille-Q4381 TaxID=3121597 RepID=UPI002FE5F454
MYIPRIADQRLENALRRKGGVLVRGPKGCGKTETSLQQSSSVLNVDTDPRVQFLMGSDPASLLEGDTPRLIDEWQFQPQLWDLARHAIDRRQTKGQFIFTGSTVPTEELTRHSGAGRFAHVTMSTLTMFETGESSGEVSLSALAEAERPSYIDSAMSLDALVERMCRGGWPDNVGLSTPDALRSNREYVEQVAHVDIRTPDGAQRSPEKVERLLASIARNVGTEADVQTLAKDAGVARETVSDYLDALSRIFISVDQPAWSAHLRSKATLRKSPKRHLVDPALAVAALKRQPRDIANDYEYAGQLFESFVVHELRAYSDEQVYHARLNTNLEVDAVVPINGRPILVEVKLGHYPQVIDAAASTLLRFADQLEADPILLVVTGGGPAYTRPDGIVVAPVSLLGP